MVGPAAKRAAVAHLQAVMSLSERRVCSIVGANRKMIRYHSSHRPDAVLRSRLRDLANERRRFGYRRPFVLLQREGEPPGINRILPAFIARKGSPSAGGVLAARPWGPGPRSWSRPSQMPAGCSTFTIQFANGRRFRMLNIVDDVTKEWLGAIPATSVSGRVARELAAIVELI